MHDAKFTDLLPTLATRCLKPCDPIDAVFQEIPRLNRKRQQNGLPAIINLSVGEPHTPINSTVLDKLLATLQHADIADKFAYSQLQGRDDALHAISLLYQYYYSGAQYNTDEVMITNGATQALWNALAILIEPNDVVLAFEPHYPTYKLQVEFFGGRFVKVASDDQTFRPSAAALLQTLKKYPTAKAIILNYPNNPTGVDLTGPEITALVEVLKAFPQLAIIVDDVYRELSNATHLTVLDNDASLKNRSIMINSGSKGLIGAPDLRVGMVGANRKWIEAMTAIQANNVCTISYLTQQALVFAVSGVFNNSASHQQWLHRAKTEYANNVAYVSNELKNMHVDVFYGGNGFFLLADFKFLLNQAYDAAPITNDNDIVKLLLHRAGVATVPGSGFGIESTRGLVRISCAKSMDLLQQALRQINEALTGRSDSKVASIN